MSIASVMPSSHLTLWYSLLFLPSIFPSIRDFSNESAVWIRWPKYWSFSFSISPSNEYSGWFLLGLTDLIFLLSKGLSRVLSSTTVRRHQFFGILPSLWSTSQLYMTTGKTTALMWLPWWLRPPYYRLKLILTAPNKLCNMRLLTQQKYINLQVKNVSIRA